MATIEERLQALEQEHQTLEQEHTQLKKTIELQTIAIRALVAKEAFEKLQDTVEKTQGQNGKLFDTLIMHDRLTNEQLVELRGQQAALNGKLDRIQTETRQQLTELDGKIVGLQTEIRQRFNEQDGKINRLQTEVQQRFNEQDGKINRLQTEVQQRFNEQDIKIAGLQTTQIEHTTLLQEILKRLPEK